MLGSMLVPHKPAAVDSEVDLAVNKGHLSVGAAAGGSGRMRW